MKGLRKLIVLSFLFIIGLGSANAAPLVIGENDINNDSYIIGTHLFDTDRSSLTTQDIMWAARTIDGGNITIDDMIIYYKNYSGEWINGLTGKTITPKNNFTIGYINKAEQKEYTIEDDVLTILLPGDYTGYAEIDGKNFKDIIIAKGIGNGDVILNNVTVNGEVFVLGGGSNSVYFKNSTLFNVEIAKEITPGAEYVRVVFLDGTTVNLVKSNSESAKIVLGDNAEILKIEINSPNTTIEIDEDATITTYPEVEIKANNAIINIPDIPTENIIFDKDVDSVTLNDDEFNAPSTPTIEEKSSEELDDKLVVKVKASDERYDLYSLEVDHSWGNHSGTAKEDKMPEFTVYANEENPYGNTEGIEAVYADWGLEVTYDKELQEWTLTFSGKSLKKFVTREDVKFYFVVKNKNGDESGSMYDVTPEMTLVHNLDFPSTPTIEGVDFKEVNDTLVVTIEANDDLYDLLSLEVDHSWGKHSGTPEDDLLEEFTVYASSANPYGSEDAKTAANEAGLTVEYNEDDNVWTLIFDESLVQIFKTRNDITFYFVVKNTNSYESGSMYDVTPEMTFTYAFPA